MTSIRTNGLTKRFGKDILAVDDLDLAIEEGEIFGFLGRNGAGKSTTINMLLNFIRPTAGSAEIFGLDIQDDSKSIRERTGVLPEGYSFDGRLTGREYVEWAIDTKSADDDPDEILSLVGISDDAERVTDGYSKGMKQRLAFGLALIGDPDLLILDEPSTGLDPSGIQQVRTVIRDRAADGTTVFFSSHHLEEVEAVCDRVGVLTDGRLVAMDTIESLRQNASGQAMIEVTCAEEPPADGLDTVAGVTDVTVKGQSVTAYCSDPAAKVDVVRFLDDRVDVIDILAENTSLEELFNELTGPGRDSVDSPSSDRQEASG